MLAGIVPASPLEEAKSRLQLPTFLGVEKRELVVAMLASVLRAMVGSKLDVTYLVSSDPSLLELSARLGAEPVEEPAKLGTSGAVDLGTRKAISEGASSSLVVLSDVPLVTASDIDRLVRRALKAKRCVVAVRSNRGGTNALWRSPPAVIAPRYGGKSFINHRLEARKAGVPFFEFRCARISLDVDTFEDLMLLARMDQVPKRYPFLSPLLEAERPVGRRSEDGAIKDSGG